MAFNLKSKLKLGGAFLEDRYGGAAIIMAFMTPIIVGGLAFGAEVGGWELTRRQVQNAADVAAFAAGTQVRSGQHDVAVLSDFAENVADQSGYKGGSEGIVVEYPPATAPNAANGADPNGDGRYVYVTLSQNSNRVFTKMFAANSSVNFTSGALAFIEAGRPACVLAMHPSASGAISTGGSTNVELSGCDIAANSISSSAITATGNGSNVEADCISAVGDVSVNNTYNLDCPAPLTNAPRTADPYANVAAPTACTSTHNLNQFPNQGSGASRCYTGSSGGVTISNNTTLASNTTYTFRNTGANALTWRINGNRTVTGVGVTLYFEGKWNVEANGNSFLNITAPTSGPLAGLAIFGSRASEVNIDLSGNNGARVIGAVYSPNNASDIVYTGSSVAYTAGQCTQVIGGTVTFTGNSDFSTDCANSGTKEIKTAQTISIVG